MAKSPKLIKNKAAQERDDAIKRQKAADKRAKTAKKGDNKTDPASKPPTKKALAEAAKTKAAENRAVRQKKSASDTALNRDAYDLMNEDPQYTTLAEALAAVLSKKGSDILGEDAIESEEDTDPVDPLDMRFASKNEQSDEGFASSDYNDEVSDEALASDLTNTVASNYGRLKNPRNATLGGSVVAGFDTVPDVVKPANKEEVKNETEEEAANYAPLVDRSSGVPLDPERSDAEALARYKAARDSVIGKPATRLAAFQNAHENTYRSYEDIASPDPETIQGALDSETRKRTSSILGTLTGLTAEDLANEKTDEADRRMAALPAPEMVDTGNAEADRATNDENTRKHALRVSQELDNQEYARRLDTVSDRPGMPTRDSQGNLRLGRRYEGRAAYANLPQINRVRTQNELRTKLGQINRVVAGLINPETNTVSQPEASDSGALSQLLSNAQMGGVVTSVKGVGKGPALGHVVGDMTTMSRTGPDGKPLSTLTDPDYAEATAVSPVMAEDGTTELRDHRNPLSSAVTLDNPLREPEPASFADTRIPTTYKPKNLGGMLGGFVPNLLPDNLQIKGGDSAHPLGELFLRRNAVAKKAGLPEPHRIIPNEDFQLTTSEGYPKGSRDSTPEETAQLNSERVGMFKTLVEGRTPNQNTFQPSPTGATSRDNVRPTTPGQDEHWPTTTTVSRSDEPRTPMYETDRNGNDVVVNGRRVQAKDPKTGKLMWNDRTATTSTETVEDWDPANNVPADMEFTTGGNPDIPWKSGVAQTTVNDELGRPIVTNPNEVNVIAGPGHIQRASELQDAYREHNANNPDQPKQVPTGAEALETVVKDAAREEDKQNELKFAMESYAGKSSSIDTHGEPTSENSGKKSGKAIQEFAESRINVPTASGTNKDVIPVQMVDPLRRTTMPKGMTPENSPDNFDENGKFIDRNALLEHVSPKLEPIPAAPGEPPQTPRLLDTGRKRRDAVANKDILARHAESLARHAEAVEAHPALVAAAQDRNSQRVAQRLRMGDLYQTTRTNNPADAPSTALSEVPGVDSGFDFGSLLGGTDTVDTKTGEPIAPLDRYQQLLANRRYDPALPSIETTLAQRDPNADTRTANERANDERIEKYGSFGGREAYEKGLRAEAAYKKSPEGRKAAKAKRAQNKLDEEATDLRASQTFKKDAADKKAVQVKQNPLNLRPGESIDENGDYQLNKHYKNFKGQGAIPHTDYSEGNPSNNTNDLESQDFDALVNGGVPRRLMTPVPNVTNNPLLSTRGRSQNWELASPEERATASGESPFPRGQGPYVPGRSMTSTVSPVYGRDMFSGPTGAGVIHKKSGMYMPMAEARKKGLLNDVVVGSEHDRNFEIGGDQHDYRFEEYHEAAKRVYKQQLDDAVGRFDVPKQSSRAEMLERKVARLKDSNNPNAQELIDRHTDTINDINTVVDASKARQKNMSAGQFGNIL